MKNSFIRVSFLSVLFFFCAEIWTFVSAGQLPAFMIIPAVILLLIFNIFPSFYKRPSKRLKNLSDGTDLLCSFLVSLCGVVLYGVYMACFDYGWFSEAFWKNLLTVFLTENLIFWNGIIRVYLTSTMIGVKWRVIGALCGMIPVANIIALYHIIIHARAEVNMEQKHNDLDQVRLSQKICATKYPIILVHGVFFRDLEKLNYWGRIPAELEKNGAKIYYGNQQSALSIAESAQEIADTIRKIITETGCEKVNIIAHSKGGLDSRYAIAKLGLSDCVASLTTINTPHRGCVFAEWILDHTSESFRQGLAKKYNYAFKMLGDENPDFLKAVNDLRASSCARFNQEVPDMQGVYYQSYGSKMNKAMTNIFPLSLSYSLAKFFDGPNDGLVTVESSKWGQKFTYLESKTVDGISHADMIDLTRHDKLDFDIREVYINLVSNLKTMGF